MELCENAVEFALVRFGGLQLGPDVGGQVGSARFLKPSTGQVAQVFWNGPL